MYIKFCHDFLEDKKDEVGENLNQETKLSVELDRERGGKQTGRNVHLWRSACLFLALICLALLLTVIVLSMKLQSGSAVCTERGGTKVLPNLRGACTYEECQDHFPNPNHCHCQQCFPGWKKFGHYCFQFSTTRLSWRESQQNCSNSGASLAIVNSQDIQRFLVEEGKMKYWIGLREKNAKWTWVNQNVLEESYWAEGTQHGDCGILNGEGSPEKNWKKASCDAYTYFICQINF